MKCELDSMFDISNNPVLEDAVDFLVYSNIWISLESVGIALTTMVLAGFPLHLVPLLISFAAPFFVYNIDRLTDAEEDEENMPRRTNFVKSYGLYFTSASIVLYLGSLLLALDKSILTFLFSLAPVIIGGAYSQLDIKDVLVVKNLVVGLSWGAAPLMVGAYFGSLSSFEVLFLSAFFIISFFRSAMVYDVKDIKGDLKEGVKTIPNVFGVELTKQVAYIIDTALILLEIGLVFQNYLSPSFLILVPFHLYIILYVKMVEKSTKEMFYSMIIDGECIFLGLLVLLMSMMGV